MLVEKVRVVKINQEYDALTLDVEMFNSCEFFIKIMKMIDDKFLMYDLKLHKENQTPEGSLLLEDI